MESSSDQLVGENDELCTSASEGLEEGEVEGETVLMVESEDQGSVDLSHEQSGDSLTSDVGEEGEGSWACEDMAFYCDRCHKWIPSGRTPLTCQSACSLILRQVYLSSARFTSHLSSCFCVSPVSPVYLSHLPPVYLCDPPGQLRGEQPSYLKGDNFFKFICCSCSEDGKESFERMRLTWQQVTLATG